MFKPTYIISPTLLNTIKRIAILVHELNRKRPSSPILTHLQTEARAMSTYASTSIEGNPLPLTEVKRLLKNEPQRARDSEREVLNYNQMLLMLHETEPATMTRDLLLSIHKGVMDGLLPEHQNGRFRQEPVVVHDPRSGEVVYLPPDWQTVPQLVEELMAFVQVNQVILDPVLLAGVFHKQMVVIHPFVDGNGRTTRLATKQLLAGLGVDTFPLFSFETYYNQNVTRYFQKVGLFGDYNELATNLDFTPWLEYFADGILDELLRVQKLLETQTTPDTALQLHHKVILAHIDAHSFITDKDYAQLTDRAKATRALDFKKLLELGLIERKGRGRSTHYKRAE